MKEREEEKHHQETKELEYLQRRCKELEEKSQKENINIYGTYFTTYEALKRLLHKRSNNRDKQISFPELLLALSLLAFLLDSPISTGRNHGCKPAFIRLLKRKACKLPSPTPLRVAYRRWHSIFGGAKVLPLFSKGGGLLLVGLVTANPRSFVFRYSALAAINCTVLIFPWNE